MDGQGIKAMLGKNIKILRARRGLSQAGLAEKADMSVTFLSTIERGIRFLQPDMMAKIATALGVEVNQLFVADLESDRANDERLNHLTEDISKNVNLAMAEVFKRYLG
jgi:transcriptional regulator with XRE-family HTH domain